MHRELRERATVVAASSERECAGTGRDDHGGGPADDLDGFTGHR
jgi:hypothetical protein